MTTRAGSSALRKARLARGWSQELVGQKLGVTGAAIGHYETGVSKPRAERAAQLAKILGLRSGDIQASTRGEGARRDGGAATKAGGKATMRTSGGVMLTDKREIAVVKALRAMHAGDRRVAMDMVIAYGRGASGVSRKRRS